MPSAASSGSVDANAGVVPTSEATIEMLAAATTMRRTRVLRDLALIATLMKIGLNIRDADLKTGRHQAPKVRTGLSRVSVSPSWKDKLSTPIETPRIGRKSGMERPDRVTKSQVVAENPQVRVDGHVISLVK